MAKWYCRARCKPNLRRFMLVASSCFYIDAKDINGSNSIHNFISLRDINDDAVIEETPLISPAIHGDAVVVSYSRTISTTGTAYFIPPKSIQEIKSYLYIAWDTQNLCARLVHASRYYLYNPVEFKANTLVPKLGPSVISTNFSVDVNFLKEGFSTIKVKRESNDEVKYTIPKDGNLQIHAVPREQIGWIAYYFSQNKYDFLKSGTFFQYSYATPTIKIVNPRRTYLLTGGIIHC